MDEILKEANELESRLKSSGYVNGWHKPRTYVGCIYILVNKLFPNMVKIGYANNLAKRVKDLSGTNLPEPYHCYASYKVTERLEDIDLHNLIDDLDPELRYDKSREFYTMSPERAYKILSAIAKISGTVDCLEKNPLNDDYFKGDNVENGQPKVEAGTWEGGRRRWTFSKLGIGIGEPLTLQGDDTKVCHVKEDNKVVEYDGETYSLAELANKLLNSTGCGGPRHFKYKGRNLEDMINDIYFGSAGKMGNLEEDSENQTDKKWCKFSFREMGILTGSELVHKLTGNKVKVPDENSKAGKIEVPGEPEIHDYHQYCKKYGGNAYDDFLYKGRSIREIRRALHELVRQQ